MLHELPRAPSQFFQETLLLNSIDDCEVVNRPAGFSSSTQTLVKPVFLIAAKSVLETALGEQNHEAELREQERSGRG